MANNETDDLLEAFKVESLESLQIAENIFLEIEKSGGLSKQFDSLFRIFHSLKGGSSMFEMKEIQGAFHVLENRLTQNRTADRLEANDLSYFLKGIDYCRVLFEGGTPQQHFDGGLHSSKAEVNSKEEPNKMGTIVAQAAKSKEVVAQNLDKLSFTVLVLDDEDDLLDLMRIILEESGFVVHTYNRPNLALEAITKVQPNVILCDMAMPEMTGLEFHRKVLEMNLTIPIPIVFISGHLSKSLLIDVVNQGADGVIEKPFNNEYVITMARSSARKHKMALLLDKTVNFLLYQYSDFDDYLKAVGKDEVRNAIEVEMTNLIAQRKFLRDLLKEHNLKLTGKK